MVKSWVRKTPAVVYLIAFILQVLSIATPGWLIYVHQNVIEKNSLFYRRTCETESLIDAEVETCKTESFRYMHLYNKKILEATQASKADLVSEDFDYNAKICRQVLIVVSTGLSLLVVVVHGIQTILKHDNMQLVLLTAIASATSAGIVLAVVSNDIIGVHYQTELQNNDNAQENTYTGIPYCLAMLAASALLHFFAEMCVGFQLYTPKMKKSDSIEEVNDIPNVPQGKIVVSCNETELGNWNEAELNNCNGTTHDSCNETTVMINGGIENPVFSEKL